VNSFRLKAFQVRRQGVRHGIRFGLNSLRAGERKAHRSRRIGGAAGSYAGPGRSGQGAPKIHGALVIAAYSIVSGGGNLDSATPLILTAMPLKLMERRRRPI
jgi:hypothetical protein